VLKPGEDADNLVVIPVGEFLELHETGGDRNVPWLGWKTRATITCIDTSGFLGFRVSGSKLFTINSREGTGVCVNVFDCGAQLGGRGRPLPIVKRQGLGEMRCLESTGETLEFKEVNRNSKFLVDAGNGSNGVVFLWVSVRVLYSLGSVTKRDVRVEPGKQNQLQIVHMDVVNAP
jgi:hypothetical protein